jgi:hypothetical protein
MHSIQFFLVYPSARIWGTRSFELYPSCSILGVPNIPQNLQFQNIPVLYRYNEKGIIHLYRYRPALVICGGIWSCLSRVPLRKVVIACNLCVLVMLLISRILMHCVPPYELL